MSIQEARKKSRRDERRFVIQQKTLPTVQTAGDVAPGNGGRR